MRTLNKNNGEVKDRSFFIIVCNANCEKPYKNIHPNIGNPNKGKTLEN